MMPKIRAWIKEENCFADCIETIRYHAKEIVLSRGGICELKILSSLNPQASKIRMAKRFLRVI